MKKAIILPQYADVKPFSLPTRRRGGRATGEHQPPALATPSSCPDDYSIAFVAGTEPRETCDQSSGQGIFSRIFGGNSEKALPPPTNGNSQPNAGVQEEEAKKKKGGASGAMIWDVDGGEYIDYHAAFGPILLGHCYSEVDRAVAKTISEIDLLGVGISAISIADVLL